MKLNTYQPSLSLSRFYRHLRNVSVEGEAGKQSIEFTPDGELRAAELKIMNLRPAIGEQVTAHSLVFNVVSFIIYRG